MLILPGCQNGGEAAWNSALENVGPDCRPPITMVRKPGVATRRWAIRPIAPVRPGPKPSRGGRTTATSGGPRGLEPPSLLRHGDDKSATDSICNPHPHLLEWTLMAARTALVVLIGLLAAVGLNLLLLQVLSPGGWTLPKLVMLAAFLGTTPWTGLCVANGLIGFLILVCSRNPVRAVFPLAEHRIASAPTPRTAIAVTVRSEDMRRV